MAIKITSVYTGFHEEPQGAALCCAPDSDNPESTEELEINKNWLHGE